MDLDRLEVHGTAGFRGAGSIGHPDRSLFPVRVELTDISPITAAASSDLRVRLAIRNVGNISVFVPVSRDYEGVLEDDGVDRRSATFGLRITPIAGFRSLPKATLSPGRITVGAKTARSTLVELKPGDAIHVRFTARLFEHNDGILQRWIDESATNIVTLRIQGSFAPNEITEDLVTLNRHGYFTSETWVDLPVNLNR